jgi:hypothetical protein
MKKNNPYRVLPQQIWTDGDLAKFAIIAFVAGIVVGVVACL